MPLPRPTPSPAAWTALLGLLAAVAPAAHAQSPLMGWTTTTRTATDSGAAQSRQVTARRVVTAGRRTRIEELDGGDTAVTRQVILNDSIGGTLTMLDPARRTAMVMASPAKEMKAIDDLMHTTTVGTPTLVVDDLGAGPVLLGHPTRHYRTTSHRVSHHEGPGFTCDESVDVRAESWTTLDSIGPRRPRRARRAPSLSTVIPPLDTAAMAKERRPRVPGRALRTETETTTTRGHSAPIVQRSVEELVELRYGPVDSALFVVPSGYAVTDTRALMSGIDMKKLFEAVSPALGATICGSAAAK